MVELRDVREVAPVADGIVAAVERELHGFLPRAEVHHIGATSLPGGQTKGDVDANVRVAPGDFDRAVALLRERYEVAQPENWTPSFASFSVAGHALPLGLQVTEIGSQSDFLLALRDRMRADPALARRYDEVKRAAAADGEDAYLRAKHAFLRDVLDGRPPREGAERLVWLIALERTVRGLLLLGAGIYLLAKSDANFGSIANHLAARLELDPHRPFIRHLVARLGHLKRHEVELFGALAVGYAALELTEGAGLFYRKRWAEWLTVVATSLLVPLELYELVRHPSALKAGGVAVNLAIVAYLFHVVRRKGRR